MNLFSDPRLYTPCMLSTDWTTDWTTDLLRPEIEALADRANATPEERTRIGIVLDKLARRLRELPDPAPPTPTLEDELRELVEKHECFHDALIWMPGMTHGSKIFVGTPWSWRQENNARAWLCDSAALAVVRSIVKAMCDEHGGAWNPKGEGNTTGQWYHYWMGETHYHRSELAAIDALLTAMEAKQ
jgi:hypothetical protein